MSRLELRNLRKTYGTTAAVDGISLTLEPGEFLTLLGPSGSGKTTTLLMIAGLVQPSAGEMLLDGAPLGPLPPYRRNLGMVFQNYALFPHLTVARNIAFPLEMRGAPKPEIRAKVSEVLSLVGLPGFEERYPNQLSGGQQQRVALARAIVFAPRLLLMDEPLGALDKKLREQMQVEIMRLHRQIGAAVVYVTHDQDEALVMSDRIAVFNRGRIEQIGRPDELYDRPATRFVAEFLGESNFLSGAVEELRDAYCRIVTPAGPVRARAADGLQPGQAAVVAVRPERVSVADGLGENAIAGTIRDVIYLGRARKYLIAIDDRLEWSVLQPPSDERVFSAGESVTLAWSAEHATALRANGPRAEG